MLTSCDRIPCKGYNIVVYRILDVLHLSRCVLTDISLNNLALTTKPLVVTCNDAVIVVSVLRIIVEIVILLTRLDCAHLLNHFAVAHDLHLHVRGELSSVDSLRRSSEVDAHLERAVGSCSCRYLGDSIRCLQRVAHNRDVVKDKLMYPPLMPFVTAVHDKFTLPVLISTVAFTLVGLSGMSSPMKLFT